MINANDFKISCSRIGRIMTESKELSNPEKIERLKADIKERRIKRSAIKEGLKSKATATQKIKSLLFDLRKMIESPNIPNLSKTAQTVCDEWIKEQIYQRRKEFTAKQTDKGNITESDGIELIERFFNWGFAAKNSQQRSNDFMRGTCDIAMDNMIVDVKSAWDCFTFPLLENELPELDYWWQLQGYMELWNKDNGMVCYVLMDMPHDMIERELRFKLKDGYTKEEYDFYYSRYIYSNIPDKFRVKPFNVKRDESAKKAIEKRVFECRQYIASKTNTAIFAD